MYYELVAYNEKFELLESSRFTFLEEAEDYAKEHNFPHYTIIKCEQIKLV